MASLIKAVREAEKSIICTGKEGISTNCEVCVKGGDISKSYSVCIKWGHNISHLPPVLDSWGSSPPGLC